MMIMMMNDDDTHMSDTPDLTSGVSGCSWPSAIGLRSGVLDNPLMIMMMIDDDNDNE